MHFLAETKDYWDFCKYISSQKDNVVNCHDQAHALNTSARLLGVETFRVYKGYPIPNRDPNANPVTPEPRFGYIQKLRFVGSSSDSLCNNPFYESDDPVWSSLGKLVDSDNLERSSFRNHSFVRLGNKYYDCCAGPVMGAESFQIYCKLVIDSFSLDEEKKRLKMIESSGLAFDMPAIQITQ